MSAQLRSELLKQRTTRNILALAGWMACLILLVLALHVFGLSVSKLNVRANQLNVLGWGTGIGALFASLVGAISITTEIRHGTIRPTLLARPNRTVVIVAKITASALSGLVVGLLAEGMAVGLGSAGLAVRGAHNMLSGGDIAQLLGGGAAAAALWAVIGTGVGAMARNQIGAIVGLCVWLLLIETVLIGNVPSVAKFAPGASAGALAGAIQNAGSAGLLAPALGALMLAAYAAAAAAAGVLTTERRDIS